jgi:hypothetical protein
VTRVRHDSLPSPFYEKAGVSQPGNVHERLKNTRFP